MFKARLRSPFTGAVCRLRGVWFSITLSESVLSVPTELCCHISRRPRVTGLRGLGFIGLRVMGGRV